MRNCLIIKQGFMPRNIALDTILAPAYAPCPEFEGACSEMRWLPGSGHVPRGFAGALGSIDEVELVLVFAEPGDPHAGEVHLGLETAYDYAMQVFRTCKDLFHRNVRAILDSCWPNLTFDEQMRKTWMTDSVLCSAKKEGGTVPSKASRACGERYLRAQLDLFAPCLVAAMGAKAASRLRAIGHLNFLPVYAAAPPGCNRREAKESWKRSGNELRRRRET
ncbi:conserved hypothetical protein [Cupriavidus phytorum]|uniref:Uracil-DNA glycosylase-like domain-containing protein n=1 Tax=Cupriavidus taiwanensis TaxID=164546 RepID=A0A975XL67_9BURK|nr:conserved hypothetical protein [Cupriavidus taiwanensis]